MGRFRARLDVERLRQWAVTKQTLDEIIAYFNGLGDNDSSGFGDIEPMENGLYSLG